jgi:hypothetical protein
MLYQCEGKEKKKRKITDDLHINTFHDTFSEVSHDLHINTFHDTFSEVSLHLSQKH